MKVDYERRVYRIISTGSDWCEEEDHETLRQSKSTKKTKMSKKKKKKKKKNKKKKKKKCGRSMSSTMKSRWRTETVGERSSVF
jgi:hypothetical protein